MMSDAPRCYACGVVLTRKAHERHHFPTPKRRGGTLTVDLCICCHDMVDRIDLDDWPLQWAQRGFDSLPREGRLLVMKVLSRLT